MATLNKRKIKKTVVKRIVRGSRPRRAIFNNASINQSAVNNDNEESLGENYNDELEDVGMGNIAGGPAAPVQAEKTVPGKIGGQKTAPKAPPTMSGTSESGTMTGGGGGFGGPTWGETPAAPGMPALSQIQPTAQVQAQRTQGHVVGQAPGKPGLKPGLDVGAQQAMGGAMAATAAATANQAQTAQITQAQQGQMQAQTEEAQARELQQEQVGAANAAIAKTEAPTEKSKGERVTSRLAGRMAAAAESGSIWPWVLALIVSLFNDFGDVIDLSVGIGVDQFLDFIVACIILSSHIFIKNQPGWQYVRGGVWILEMIPGIGILPLWSIGTIYLWRKARKHQEQMQAEQASAAQAEQVSESQQVQEQRVEDQLQRSYEQEQANV